MSMTMDVLRNRNKIERDCKHARNKDLQDLKNEASYIAKLKDDIEVVAKLLLDNEVECVNLEIPIDNLPKFMRAMYTDVLSEFSISQVSATVFAFRLKVINI